ncbi:MAG TPA: Gfo/Idh/MocA family oxidoreductase [Pyrinomonadaceae bacterium]|nr:Gfo/Idh/MocA family oxidoreductase [Pyrinomonadaceae bacterium]
MNGKVRWGVLGAAKIAVEKVIPAMQRGAWSEVSAIASRDSEKAGRAAEALGIPKAYGSYEELLADPLVEAVYNPLPNDLHVPWTIKAAEAGKHVLCEKPLSLNLEEARRLLDARDRTGVKIQEAFMVRTHPQWLGALALVRAGRVGELRAINGLFSYFNLDAANIRNRPETGGGALMDIGCYPVTISRLFFDEEPRRVSALIERDPEFGTDRLTSAIMDFPSGHATFTCSTQLAPYQRMHFLGTRGRIEVLIPFNAPSDRPMRILVDDGSDLFGTNIEVVEFPACDQYEIQGDLFSRAIRENTAQPIPLEDAVNNMAVIEAIFRSAESGNWETPDTITIPGGDEHDSRGQAR